MLLASADHKALKSAGNVLSKRFAKRLMHQVRVDLDEYYCSFLFLWLPELATFFLYPLGILRFRLAPAGPASPMTATMKKLHQGLDNVDFIGPENINRPASDKVPVH